MKKRLKAEGKKLVVITQNIDELHRRAGTENLIELHGSLFRVICTSCRDLTINNESPICEALRGTGTVTVYLFILLKPNYFKKQSSSSSCLLT